MLIVLSVHTFANIYEDTEKMSSLFDKLTYLRRNGIPDTAKHMLAAFTP